MKDLLNAENLIELHENLNEFAKHHQNKGGQMAHQLIKTELIDKVKEYPKDGSPEGLLRDEGFDMAVKQALSILHRSFVP